MVRHPGCFTRHVTPTTRLDSIEALAEIFSLRRGSMLVSGHVRFAWRGGRNRANDSVFLSAFAVLTITGYGLYYAGGERLRAWTSWIHLAVGLALPILLLIHILLGKRTRPTDQSSTKSRLA